MHPGIRKKTQDKDANPVAKAEDDSRFAGQKGLISEISHLKGIRKALDLLLC